VKQGLCRDTQLLGSFTQTPVVGEKSAITVYETRCQEIGVDVPDAPIKQGYILDESQNPGGRYHWREIVSLEVSQRGLAIAQATKRELAKHKGVHQNLISIKGLA
jgi:hypothetical protein